MGIIRGLPLRGALLHTTRGCPYSCSFCGCNLIFGRNLRFRNLSVIEKEIKYLKEIKKIEGIWIIDDTFTINKEHIIGVAKILKKYNLIWGCQSRVNTINVELIRIMKENGCVQLDFGIESGSQRILDDIIGKRININQVINSFKLAKKYKIRTLANFMIGFPTETYNDLNKTIKLAKLIKADIYIFSIATPLPGTELYKMIGEEIKPEEYSLLDWNGGELTDRLNKSEIKNICEELNKINYYFFKTTLFRFFSIRNLILYFRLPNKFKRTYIVLKKLFKLIIIKYKNYKK